MSSGSVVPVALGRIKDAQSAWRRSDISKKSARDIRRQWQSLVAGTREAARPCQTRTAAQDPKVIEPSRPQLSFAAGLIREEVGPLWEEWMRKADEVLADRALVQIVYEALARRWPRSRTRGQPGTCRSGAAPVAALAGSILA